VQNTRSPGLHRCFLNPLLICKGGGTGARTGLRGNRSVLHTDKAQHLGHQGRHKHISNACFGSMIRVVVSSEQSMRRVTSGGCEIMTLLTKSLSNAA